MKELLWQETLTWNLEGLGRIWEAAGDTGLKLGGGLLSGHDGWEGCGERHRHGFPQQQTGVVLCGYAFHGRDEKSSKGPDRRLHGMVWILPELMN